MTCSAFEAPHFGSHPIATTLAIPEGHRAAEQQQQLRETALPDRSQPGQVPETLEKVLMGADPNKGVGDTESKAQQPLGDGAKKYTASRMK